MPKTFILVPGYGAQGGKGKDLVHFFNKDGLGAIVNSSRGIIAAYKQEKYASFGAEGLCRSFQTGCEGYDRWILVQHLREDRGKHMSKKTKEICTVVRPGMHRNRYIQLVDPDRRDCFGSSTRAVCIPVLQRSE